MHVRITFAAHDMNAFAELGRIAVDQYRLAPAGPQNVTPDNSIMLDLMRDEWTIADEKFITAETAAALIGCPVEEVIPRGRQAVARGLDEDREYLRSRRKDIYDRAVKQQLDL